MERGIIYVATGQDYQTECCKSAKSVKNSMPDIPVTVFSDEYFECDSVDDVILIGDPKYNSIDVIESLSETPYERTLYLDTDTYVWESVKDIFNILQDYDIAAVHDTRHSNHHKSPISSIPSGYPEYNTGVIAYQKNKPVIKFFDKWKNIFQESEDVIDQPSFRAALYDTKLNIATLPPEYNCLYSVNPGYLNGYVKIFHGRLAQVDGYKGLNYKDKPEAVREKLNSTNRPRVYIPSKGFAIVSKPDSISKKLLASVRRVGVKRTFKKAIDEITGN